VVAMPDVKARLTFIGAETTVMSQAEFAAFHKAENQRYAELIKRRGITKD